MENYSRDENIYLAKIYESTEKFEDMVNHINQFVKQDPKLNLEERNILASGFKNIIARKRVSWRELGNAEKKEENKKNLEYIRELRESVEQDLKKLLNSLLDVIEKYLLNSTEEYETKVFYLKLKGDNLRYLAEITLDDEYEKYHKLSEKAYQEGYLIAEKRLPIKNSIRLGLALNYSVLFYEVKLMKEEALKIAQDAYDQSMKIIDDLDKTKAKDTILIIQLLKENLILWGNDNEEGGADDEF